jgi:hypothetical protein
MSPPAQLLSAHAFAVSKDAASPSLPDQTTSAAVILIPTPFYSVPATSPRLRRGDADGRPMILRRLHGRVSRLSLASAALLDPSAGLFSGFHGAAGDGASSEHGRKPAGTSSSPSSSPMLIDSSIGSKFHMRPDARSAGLVGSSRSCVSGNSNPPLLRFHVRLQPDMICHSVHQK